MPRVTPITFALATALLAAPGALLAQQDSASWLPREVQKLPNGQYQTGAAVDDTTGIRMAVQSNFTEVALGRLADSRLVATRLAPRRMYLCASPAYLERYGRPHSLSELAGHNCLVGSSDLWALQQDGREISQRVQGNWRCNSGQAVLDAALQGMGLCQLPDYYVLEHLKSGALISLLEAHQPPNTAVWALYPQQRHLSPKVRKLVDYLKEGLAERPEYRA